MGGNFMITVKNISKTFNTPTGKVEVLRDISLEIARGDIFGVIGFSGAGKSTLIRCLNGLEKPDSGNIIIGENEITKLNGKELRSARKKIGMIFQQFNLFDSKTVYENIAFPLEISGYKKEEIKRRVEEILELVELSEKRDSYPLQLSGGQKQRVGIARALANDPDVLLSDEATSALDPQTTFSILELLKNINQRLSLTIVIITHELDVLRYCTNNMVVLEDGHIVEEGNTENLFLNPKSDTLKKFITITKGFQNNGKFSGGEGI
jgi:D-methionine transport system ATP-binding protein